MPEGYSRPFPQIPEREALRYLGCRGSAPEDRVRERIEEVIGLLKEAAAPRLVRQRFEIGVSGEEISLSGLMIKSKDLLINLKSCRAVFLTAATLGSGVDRLMTRLSLTSSFDMLLLQALAAACLEEVLDREEAAMKAEIKQEGLTLRPRFSPGYGDLPLGLQPDLIRLTNAGKLIGLSVTDSLMLTPQKSVTAITGLIRGGEDKGRQSPCQTCEKKDCAVREIREEGEEEDALQR